jgi:4-diphosphocytidyl-2-C-methyl-D-erythritol kinase
MALVLVPQAEGLSTAAVYAEADRLGATRASLDPDAARALAARPLAGLAQALDNDLQRAALSLRPDLERPLADLRAAGALAALVTGSGPTTFGVFADRAGAERASEAIPGSLVSTLRS